MFGIEKWAKVGLAPQNWSSWVILSITSLKFRGRLICSFDPHRTHIDTHSSSGCLVRTFTKFAGTAWLVGNIG